ncbi:hypothetical protein [Halarcobacter sp.]|uniref:hypothetical protein n=1 Tax=Halarcobacter sp. TaxID=2321133 RepID=UPI0029F57D47|nr:hypothetical protein [Halarcobacter sp.]
MYTLSKLESIYIKSKNDLKTLLKNDSLNEQNLNKLIVELSIDSNYLIFTNNTYNITSIKKIFKFYETIMKRSFPIDKKLFHMQFTLYLHLIKLFSHLCRKIYTHNTNREQVKQILQIMQESKNMLKLSIPLDGEIINIINNIIGQHLYKFTHSDYIDIDKKDIDYIFDYYIYSSEKIIDGYELSQSTNFGNNSKININIELLKVKNNLSFLLLSMIYKIDFYFPKLDINENPNYQKIFQYISELSFFNVDIDIKNFKTFLLDEFKDSSKKLILNNKKHYYDEKISILTLNTDEYKELIDIISQLK